MCSKKKRWNWGYMVLLNLLFLIVAIVFIIIGGRERNAVLTIVSNDNRYVWANHTSPPKYPFIRINNKIYFEPSDINPILSILERNFTLEDDPTIAYEGYAVENNYGTLSDIEYIEIPTEVIGKTISVVNVSITNTEYSWVEKISWQRYPRKKIISNCEKKIVWIDSSYKPGSTTYTLQTRVLISLDNLIEMYDSQIEYDLKRKVLYFYLD